MGNYKLIANESYDMIGKEIDSQIELNPGVREIKFVKVDGMQLMYDAYALQGTDIPAIKNADFFLINNFALLSIQIQADKSLKTTQPKNTTLWHKKLKKYRKSYTQNTAAHK